MEDQSILGKNTSHEVEPEPVPAQQPAQISNTSQPTKGGKVTEELRRWLKLTTICYGAGAVGLLIGMVVFIIFPTYLLFY
jgi:hypothetical protein